MCNRVILTGKNGGNVHYAVLLMIFVLIVLMSFVFMESRVIMNQKDKMDNSLLISAFSASLCDCEQMAGRMAPIKVVKNDKVFFDFEQMYHGMGIIVSTDNVQIMENAVTTLIIYNVDDDLKIYKLENGEESFVTIPDYSEANTITAPNGVPILKTSVYVKAEFVVKGMLGRKKSVFLEKCIALQFANE